MLHESLVGCSRRRTPFCSGLRFLRGFFSFGLLTFALMKAGGGVFCFSSSWMRAWATRNCSWVSCNCSRACFSWASKDAIRSSALMAPVYQTRFFVNSILEQLAVPVTGVISDGEETIGSAVAFVFPEVPHQRCQFHYLKDATEPLYDADRHAKTQLKKYVRGVRPLERALEGRCDPEAEAIRGY